MYHPDPFFSDLEDPLFWEGVSGQTISQRPLSPDPSPAWRTPTRYIIIEEAPQSQVVEGWLLPAPVFSRQRLNRYLLSYRFAYRER